MSKQDSATQLQTFLDQGLVKVRKLGGNLHRLVCNVLTFLTVLNSGENSVKAKCAKSDDSCQCKHSWPPHHHVPRAAPRGSHQWGPNLRSNQTLPKSSWSLWNRRLVPFTSLYQYLPHSVLFGLFLLLLLRWPKQTSLATWWSLDISFALSKDKYPPALPASHSNRRENESLNNWSKFSS